MHYDWGVAVLWVFNNNIHQRELRNRRDYSQVVSQVVFLQCVGLKPMRGGVEVVVSDPTNETLGLEEREDGDGWVCYHAWCCCCCFSDYHRLQTSHDGTWTVLRVMNVICRGD